MNDRDRFDAQLRRHEAERLKPYLDCCGKPWRECRCAVKGNLTIGIGRNLDAYGITPRESAYLLQGNVDTSTRELVAAYPAWFPDLDPVRQFVLVNMHFNMGAERLAGFKNMLRALAAGQYGQASDAMMDSLWAKQTGARASELAAQMRTGQWQM